MRYTLTQHTEWRQWRRRWCRLLFATLGGWSGGDCGCFDMWKHNNAKKVGALSVYVCACVRLCALFFWDHWRLFFGLTQLCNTYALPTDDYNPLGKNKYYNKLNQNLQFARFATECNKCGNFCCVCDFPFCFFPFLFHRHPQPTYSQTVYVACKLFSPAQTWPTNTLYWNLHMDYLLTNALVHRFFPLPFPSPFYSLLSFFPISISFGWVCWFCSRHHYYMCTRCIYTAHIHTYAQTLFAYEIVCPTFINAHSWTLIKNGYNQNIP